MASQFSAHGYVMWFLPGRMTVTIKAVHAMGPQLMVYLFRDTKIIFASNDFGGLSKHAKICPGAQKPVVT